LPSFLFNILKEQIFKFKQFSLSQGKSAMKLGTDAVVLGAYVNPYLAKNILDIGTGTGILALMMAQKSDALIQAVEIDEVAASEAEFNFKHSNWLNRISLYSNSIQDFRREFPDVKFDLIITNPPYFVAGNQFEIEEEKRRTARHTNTLSFEELAKIMAQLLHENGTIAMVLPNQEAELFIQIAETCQLFPKEILQVFPKKSKPFNRLVMLFSKQKQNIIQQELVIYNEDNSYTETYYELTKDFYLWKDKT
jgi:tRNA1Val (adenine37-N6)-methyltransferase